MHAEALLALWNDVDPSLDAAYDEWHAREHVPERLTVPGLLWGRRYRKATDEGMPRYLTLYGLRDAAVLDSEPYQRLLREPTPTSRRMRPELVNVSRWVCRLEARDDANAGTHLAVWTFEHADDPTLGAPELHDRRPAGYRGHLVARRLPQAAALPWLQAAQSRTVEGQGLSCVALEGFREDDPVLAGATVYQRLRTGEPFN